MKLSSALYRFAIQPEYVMKKLAYAQNKVSPHTLVIIATVLYVVVFAAYHHSVGIGLAALAAIPVVGAAWYFGVRGGTLTAILSILANMVILMSEGYSHRILLDNTDNLVGAFALIFIGVVAGKFSSIIAERQEVILKLKTYEQERQSHTEFLQRLQAITRLTLEADSWDATLKTLVERVAQLFEATDCFLSLWDESKGVPVPTAAYGSISEIYPYMQFEPGERTLTTSVLEIKEPVAVPDIENSPYINPNVAAIFPSRSMLGFPLIVQNRKLGAILLGYSRIRSFRNRDITRASIAAEQIGLIVSKSLLLEEERKQVKQLTALHDIALIAIDVNNEEELINRVTDVIGQNLFPDNFGILLLDEQARILHPHVSYRFSCAEERHRIDVHLNEGITGQVVATGKPQRLGNVRRVKEYLDVDDRTISELCVPIKFKEQILGVINAESTKRDAFTEDDERLLVTLAGQLATAMEQIRRSEAERKWLDQLAHSNDLIYALAQITTHIEKAFSIEDIIQNLGKELSKIELTCIVALYDSQREAFTVDYTSMEPSYLEIVEKNLGYPLTRYTFARDKLNSKEIQYPAALSRPEDEIQKLFDRLHREDILEMLQAIGIGRDITPLRLPLIFEDNLLGIIWIWGHNLKRTDVPVMSIFAKQIGVSLERARLFQEVQSLALTDPLTNLHNRRSVFELGRVEFARAHRMNRAFCCMMLDLDNFKQINDTYGHPVGDQVLKEFARRCKISVREVDLVGRYGGEEVIILLPETDRGTALAVAERLRASVAAASIKVSDREIAMTVSIGVAAKDEHTLNLDTLIARADQAMYIAKHKGRNRVAMSK